MTLSQTRKEKYTRTRRYKPEKEHQKSRIRTRICFYAFRTGSIVRLVANTRIRVYAQIQPWSWVTNFTLVVEASLMSHKKKN